MTAFRGIAAAALVTVLACLAACTPASRAPAPSRSRVPTSPVPTTAGGGTGTGHWVTTWAASPQAPAGTAAARGFDGQTIRDIVFTSAGGRALRVELTNAYGSRPLFVGAVTVGGTTGGGATGGGVTGTMHAVRFGGSPSVLVPAGAQVWSDPVQMTVPPLADLAVSVYVPAATGPATAHVVASQSNWVSARGNHAGQASAGAFPSRVNSWFFLAAVSVLSAGSDGTVVAFGDSITDGYGSTSDANERWPNLLARRLEAAGGTLGVADAGIAGNRVLSDAEGSGVAGLSRFGRDVLDQPGVRDVIVLEGVNDILVGDGPRSLRQTGPVSAAQLIAAYRTMIAAAHARGVRIFGATITPFGGSRYDTPAAEQVREQVNTWIRTSGAFDGVIDFDKAVRSRSDARFLAAGYDSGDGLHPDDAGYQAMADAVGLPMLLH